MRGDAILAHLTAVKPAVPDDRTPNADELSSTTDKTGPGTVNEIVPPRPPAESRSTESLHDDALRDTASNEDDNTRGS